MLANLKLLSHSQHTQMFPLLQIRSFSLFKQTHMITKSQTIIPVAPKTLSFPIRSLFIQTESTPNPYSMKFLPGKPVLGDEMASLDFFSYKQAQTSPLAKKIFEIDGIRGVFFGEDFITVNVGEEFEWTTMKPYVFSAITDFYQSGEPVVHADSDVIRDSDTVILDDDDEVVAMIKELIESRVKPAVQQDGGDIKYIRFDEKSGLVYLQLMGACVGCPSSIGTLKHGIQNMLMHYIPEVNGVEEYMDENHPDHPDYTDQYSM